MSKASKRAKMNRKVRLPQSVPAEKGSRGATKKNPTKDHMRKSGPTSLPKSVKGLKT